MEDKRKRFKNPNPKPPSERAKPRVKAEDKEGVDVPPASGRPITKTTGTTTTATESSKPPKPSKPKKTAKKAAAKKKSG